MSKSIALKEIVGYLTEDDSVLFYDNKTLEEIPGEVFKEYPFNSQYLVSNLGRVKSKEQSVNHPTGRKAIKKEKILTQTDNGSGYLSVSMYFEGKSKTLRVSRVVAITWIDNPEDKPQVNHKKGKKYDNREWMLEWNTAGENVRHSWSTGLCRKSDYHLEVVSKMKIINNYLAYTPTVITPIGKGKITIDDAAYRIIYENGKMENLVKSVRFWKKEFKLVLRDLSDLTKEITHNGETFVPIVKIGEMLGYDKLIKFNEDSGYEFVEYGYVERYADDQQPYVFGYWKEGFFGFWYDEQDDSSPVNHFTSLSVINLLYELKFDIYDWIKDGLAVDINTI